MLKKFPILIITFVSFVNLFGITFASYCQSNKVVNQAINLGTNIYIGQGSRAFWKFNPDVRRIIDTKLDLESIFGKNSFDWIDTAFTFVFDDCDRNTRTDSFCEAINKAKDLVIAFGRRKNLPAHSIRYGYRAYHVGRDDTGYGHQLIQINDTDDYIAWDLKSTDNVFGEFLVKIPGLGDHYYESSVFVKSRNQLIVSLFDVTDFTGKAYHLMSLKLEDDGLWAPKWVQISDIGFRGMFEINDRVFGFDIQNKVVEFKWSDDKTISFEPISDLKELFNCFGNSSLWDKNDEIPFLWDSLDNTTSPSSTTTSTTSAFQSTSSSTTVGSINEEENEIHVKTEAINYETIGPEVALLTNVTENSTQTEPQMNQKLEELTDRGQDDASDWSALFVVSILLLIIVIVIALIIIVRNKSKSRVVYLNSKSDDSKSAEIPLNNNDKSLHTKDV